MNVVVDTNVFFAALRATNSKFLSILIDSDDDFYAPNFVVSELFRHRNRIVEASKARDNEIFSYLTKVVHFVRFVPEEIISTENFISAFHLCKTIDENDTPFVALSLELEAHLWTKDQKLRDGLVSKGFRQFYK